MKTAPHNAKDQLYHYLNIARRNAAYIFIIFVIGIYGFLSWKILSLYGTEPDPLQVSAELQTVGVPKVDPTVVNKMQQLVDNSVSVQTLYEQARRNPFQE